MLEKCMICPHECGVNRMNDEIGLCRAGKNVRLALVSIHEFEEPCISLKNGSGTVFFSNCNMKCIYCQNYKISQENVGIEVSIEKLSDIFLQLQEKGVNNINLVTPTIYAFQILEALKIAKNQGLKIPVIYNSSGYEKVETLKMLNGYIDVYLPDFKYGSNLLGEKYSGIKGYFDIAAKAIFEMYNQVGNVVLDENGIIKKGLVIRHLILPGNVRNSIAVLKYIKENIGVDVYLSIMAQYFPTYKAKNDTLINRKLNKKELEIVEKYLEKLGFENGYMQKLGKNEEEYVPNFDLTID